MAGLSGLAPGAEKSFGLHQRTVAAHTEDTFTLGAEAALRAVQMHGQTNDIGACILGSETPLYATNPTSNMIAETLGLREDIQAGDAEFACKSGTFAMDMLLDRVTVRTDESALLVAADVGTGKVGDPLFMTAGAGAAAFTLSTKDPIAIVTHRVSRQKNREDFWRPHGESCPSHAGRWSNASYHELVTTTATAVLEQAKLDVSDIDHAVLHMPNAKLPTRAARALGLSNEQMEAGFIFPWSGNMYAACALMGLCAVLDIAQPNQTILLVSYGSGAGADAMIIRTTERITAVQRGPKVKETLQQNPALTAEQLAVLTLNR